MVNTTGSLSGAPDANVGRVGRPGERRGGPETNTSAILDEMQYTDEEADAIEVVGTLAADGWHAALEDRRGSLRAVPLVCWSVVEVGGEAGLLYGIAPDANLVDLAQDVGDRDDFRGYINLGLNVDPLEISGADIEAALYKQSIEQEEK
jgi:hypothetical protein